ncbi:MAG: hypothetical protein WC511_02225 [Candidatus Pacearchaeota archaeon]
MKHFGFDVQFVSHRSSAVSCEFADFPGEDEERGVPLPQKGQLIYLRARPYHQMEKDAVEYAKHAFMVQDVVIDYFGREITVLVSCAGY